MFAVLKVSKPCLELRRIIFADHFTVSDNGGFTRDRCPFACRIEESNIDLRIRLEVVSFAGFGVGMEEKVDSAPFLRGNDD